MILAPRQRGKKGHPKRMHHSPHPRAANPADSESRRATRDAMRLIAEQLRQSKKPAFLFVNNRLEGNAPTTIEAVADALV